MQKEIRCHYADWIKRCPADKLQEEIDICIDGVVDVTPPPGDVARENFLKAGIARVWRKLGEHYLPPLAGFDKCANPAPV